MKDVMTRIKRNVSRDAACINSVTVIIFACASALLGLLFSLGGVDWEVYEEIEQPNFYLPPFLMIMFMMMFYAILGAASGIVFSTPYYRQSGEKWAAIALAACIMFLCFTWIPLVYTATRFIMGAIVYLLAILFGAVLFKLFLRINRIAAWLVILFMGSALYMVCYSFILFIIN